MSDETKDVVASAPETVVEDNKMDVDATTVAPAAEGSAAEEQKNGRDNNNKRDNNRGSYSKLSVIPPVKDEPGTVLPEDEEEGAKHDLTIPKIDGLEEKDVIDLLNKAAKQGQWDEQLQNTTDQAEWRLIRSQLLLLRRQPADGQVLLHLDHLQLGRMGPARHGSLVQAYAGVPAVRPGLYHARPATGARRGEGGEPKGGRGRAGEAARAEQGRQVCATATAPCQAGRSVRAIRLCRMCAPAEV